MYGLHDYTWMITDEERMGAYVRALQAVVQPGSVVADIGTGTGIFALVACRLGARRVFAIDTNDAIEVGRELARENGVADRIVFFQKDSREVELPERADVVVSDLRGTVPLNGDHIAIIADARSRFVKPGGVLIPARDRLLVAAVEKAELYECALGPTEGPLGISLEAMRARLRQAMIVDRRSTVVGPENLLTAPAVWATLDYETIQPGSVSGRVELTVQRSGAAHGLSVWFETSLVQRPGVELGYSMAPGHELCYGRFFLPWPVPVHVDAGDVVSRRPLGAIGRRPVGLEFIGPVGERDRARESFKQSTSSSVSREGRGSRGASERGLG